MKDPLLIGASWYPELWPSDEWPGDIRKMQEIGFGIVRLFEFAWKRFEPAEGQFEFAWALDILDQLEAAGIKAMLGTPTAAPPAWLTTAYPEVLKIDKDGKQKTHGKRKHYNPHSSKYLELSAKIAEAMAEQLGSHPAVHSWQIDNEMSGFDYGPETRDKFHQWLKARYLDIGTLNRTWGLDFWSQAYDDFSQIPLCQATVGSIEVPERNHPSLIMAIAAFQNQGWARFIRNQVSAIRKHCHQPITTNMTGFIGAMDWPNHFKLLDRAGTSTYADLSYFHFHYSKMDRLRSDKPVPYWLLETAPNWSGGGPIWNIHHDERGIRAFSWMSVMLGGSMVLYWQWRSHWAGQEMQHGTCVSATGQWMPGKATWKQLADEFKSHETWFAENPAARGPLGIMTSSRNAWLFSIDPIHTDNRYDRRLIEDYYMPLVRNHYHRDIINESNSLDPYRLLICPHMAILDKPTRDRLTNWVQSGGCLLLGPLTGYRTEEMTAFTDKRFGGLESLMGGEVSVHFTPHWVEDTITVQMSDGFSCHPRIWCDGFKPDPETQVLASYKGGYGDGHAAVLSRYLGQGQVITMGTSLDEKCYLHLVNLLALKADVHATVEGSPDILSCPRVDAEGNLAGIGLVNTVKEARKVTIRPGASDLFSGKAVDTVIEMDGLDVKMVIY